MVSGFNEPQDCNKTQRTVKLGCVASVSLVGFSERRKSFPLFLLREGWGWQKIWQLFAIAATFRTENTKETPAAQAIVRTTEKRPVCVQANRLNLAFKQALFWGLALCRSCVRPQKRAWSRATLNYPANTATPHSSSRLGHSGGRGRTPQAPGAVRDGCIRRLELNQPQPPIQLLKHYAIIFPSPIFNVDSSRPCPKSCTQYWEGSGVLQVVDPRYRWLTSGFCSMKWLAWMGC